MVDTHESVNVGHHHTTTTSDDGMLITVSHDEQLRYARRIRDEFLYRSKTHVIGVIDTENSLRYDVTSETQVDIDRSVVGKYGFLYIPDPYAAKVGTQTPPTVESDIRIKTFDTANTDVHINTKKDEQHMTISCKRISRLSVVPVDIDKIYTIPKKKTTTKTRKRVSTTLRQKQRNGSDVVLEVSFSKDEVDTSLDNDTIVIRTCLHENGIRDYILRIVPMVIIGRYDRTTNGVMTLLHPMCIALLGEILDTYALPVSSENIFTSVNTHNHFPENLQSWHHRCRCIYNMHLLLESIYSRKPVFYKKCGTEIDLDGSVDAYRDQPSLCKTYCFLPENDTMHTVIIPTLMLRFAELRIPCLPVIGDYLVRDVLHIGDIDTERLSSMLMEHVYGDRAALTKIIGSDTVVSFLSAMLIPRCGRNSPVSSMSVDTLFMVFGMVAEYRIRTDKLLQHAIANFVERNHEYVLHLSTVDFVRQSRVSQYQVQPTLKRQRADANLIDLDVSLGVTERFTKKQKPV